MTAHRNTTYNGSTSDTYAARAVLGDRGIISAGVAYAWCPREGAYHITPPLSMVEQERINNRARTRVANGRYMGRARTLLRPRTDTRTRTHNGTHTRSLLTLTSHRIRSVQRTATLTRSAMILDAGGGM